MQLLDNAKRAQESVLDQPLKGLQDIGAITPERKLIDFYGRSIGKFDAGDTDKASLSDVPATKELGLYTASNITNASTGLKMRSEKSPKSLNAPERLTISTILVKSRSP